ncbi:MAG: sigma-54-dependent transcriptional regulator, partial [Nitrospinota bacterium]
HSENSFKTHACVDIFLPDVSGIQILKELLHTREDIPVLMITGSRDVDTAVASMKLGAYDYINKPLNLSEVVIIAKKAIESTSMKREMAWRVEKERKIHGAHSIIGSSSEMQAVQEMIHKVAKSETSTVLVEGESGTGKDLVAKAIHYTSRRLSKPFIDINCTAMPDSLVESELFGFEKGAFTDAKNRKAGLFELSDGGTILLDEIGDVSAQTQAKLLKLIENKRFKRIGGVSDIEVDVRVIAATNKDLKAEVKKGQFREDLYYRLRVIPIVMPPLRKRGNDILTLADFFIEKFNKEFRKSISGLHAETKEAFLKYTWPGNVRELKNVIERAIILESQDLILPAHLPVEVLQEERSVRKNSATALQLTEKGVSLEKIEKDLLKQALGLADGNQSKAAKLLGLTRYAFRYRLKKIGEIL